MFDDWTEGQFLALSERFRHKIAVQLLRRYYEHHKDQDLRLYRKVEKWMNLPSLLESDFPLFSDRYHFHLEKGGLSLQEHNFLTSPIHQVDTPSDTPYLPLSIYLDNLRSAFNVGSILRTTEAFRLGTLFFSPTTPFIDNQKVQKTSMWTYDKVPCKRYLPDCVFEGPLIALETSPEAPSIFDFSFPANFTLILGNEEYGISSEWLEKADYILKIPLHGFKNSLNVASAYAIAAGVISHQLRKSKHDSYSSISNPCS